MPLSTGIVMATAITVSSGRLYCVESSSGLVYEYQDGNLAAPDPPHWHPLTQAKNL